MNILRRIPRMVLFLLAGLIQVALIAAIVYDRARMLREGTEVMLQTRPVDPRDFLRGDYVELNYDISSPPADAIKDRPVTRRGSPLFVKLARKADGFFEAVSVHQAPVPLANGEVLIRGRILRGDTCGTENRFFCERLLLRYGIERYFVPEGEGRDIESARNQGKVAIVAAVTPGGRAAIKRLIIDGRPVYNEPLY
jgi:uncharacterized membrane-anchored protein